MEEREAPSASTAGPEFGERFDGQYGDREDQYYDCEWHKSGIYEFEFIFLVVFKIPVERTLFGPRGESSAGGSHRCGFIELDRCGRKGASPSSRLEWGGDSTHRARATRTLRRFYEGNGFRAHGSTGWW